MRTRGVVMGWMFGAAFAAEPASAQVGRTDSLQEIGVRGERKTSPNDVRAATFSPGLNTVTLDSAVLRLYAQQSVATLLAEQSSVFVKSYGFNALATLNFRGASAAQSLVLWNGVPLQNAALGLSDVSLLPVSLMDKVSVLYGASAGLWGSGAVGGAVLLESRAPDFEKSLRRVDASASVGSFGQVGGLLRGDVSGRRIDVSVRAFSQKADNDFWTPATILSPEEEQRNAMLRGAGGLVRAAVKISNREIIEAHGWVQRYDRQIPRALFDTSILKSQIDRSLRGLITYRRVARIELGGKLAGLVDELTYRDPAARIHSQNISRQIFGEASARWKSKNERSEILMFTPVQLSWMDRADTVSVAQRRVAMAAAGKTTLGLWFEGVMTARVENIDGRTVFLPGVNASAKATAWLTFRGALQRTYRAPTLNELHYFPGGNPDLKPEEGWGGEVGYTLRTTPRRGWTFRQEATVYRRDIRNWILWFGGAIWTPHNIAAVRSQGLELDNRLMVRVASNAQLVFTGAAAYARAETRESALPADGSVGKQLPYTPKILANGSAGLYIKNFLVSYQHFYTGLRYVTADESFALPYYATGGVNAVWDGKLGGHPAAFSVRAANLWGEDYTVVAGRPMPRRNFLATARFGI